MIKEFIYIPINKFLKNSANMYQLKNLSLIH